MDPILVTLAVFTSVTLGVGALAMWVRDAWVRRREHLRGRLGVQTPSRVKGVAGDSLARPTGGAAGRFDRWLERVVLQAGFPITPQAALLMAVAAGLLLGGSLFVLFGEMPVAFLGMLAGVLLVSGVLAHRVRSRRRKLQAQLPEVLDLLARSVRAGESLEQAVAMAGTCAAEPASAEFRRCARQLELGLSVESAMEGMTRRAPLAETRILAATLMVQRLAGGDLAVTLERLATTFRDRLAYHRQFRAATAAGRTSALLIAGATAAAVAYMALWKPDYIQEFGKSVWGQAMLGVAIALEIVGLAWLFRVLSPDY